MNLSDLHALRIAGQNILISIEAVLHEIKRIQFTLLDPEDPDIIGGLTESQLKEPLNQKGE